MGKFLLSLAAVVCMAGYAMAQGGSAGSISNYGSYAVSSYGAYGGGSAGSATAVRFVGLFDRIAARRSARRASFAAASYGSGGSQIAPMQSFGSGGSQMQFSVPAPVAVPMAAANCVECQQQSQFLPMSTAAAPCVECQQLQQLQAKVNQLDSIRKQLDSLQPPRTASLTGSECNCVNCTCPTCDCSQVSVPKLGKPGTKDCPSGKCPTLIVSNSSEDARQMLAALLLDAPTREPEKDELHLVSLGLVW